MCAILRISIYQNDRVPLLPRIDYGTAETIMAPPAPYGHKGLGYPVPRYHEHELFTHSIFHLLTHPLCHSISRPNNGRIKENGK